MRWLEALELEGLDTMILQSHLRHLLELDCEIIYVEGLIASEALRDDDVSLLLTLTGVSFFGALPSSALITASGFCPAATPITSGGSTPRM